MLEDLQRLIEDDPGEVELERRARELVLAALDDPSFSVRDVCASYFCGVWPALPAFARGWADDGDGNLVLEAGLFLLAVRQRPGPRHLDAPPYQWGVSLWVNDDFCAPFACGEAFDLDDAKERAILRARLSLMSSFPFLL